MPCEKQGESRQSRAEVLMCERQTCEGRGERGRTVEEVALLNAELAYAGAEPEEGETKDGAEQGHGCGSIGRHSVGW